VGRRRTICVLKALRSAVGSVPVGFGLGANFPDVIDKISHNGISSIEELVSVLGFTALTLTATAWKDLVKCFKDGNPGSGGDVRQASGSGGVGPHTLLAGALGECRTWILISGAAGLVLVDAATSPAKGVYVVLAVVGYLLWLVAVGDQLSEWLVRGGPGEDRPMPIGIGRS